MTTATQTENFETLYGTLSGYAQREIDAKLSALLQQFVIEANLRKSSVQAQPTPEQ